MSANCAIEAKLVWLTQKNKLCEQPSATQRNLMLTQIFIYETLPDLTNINSTLDVDSVYLFIIKMGSNYKEKRYEKISDRVYHSFRSGSMDAGSWFFFNSIAVGAQGSATPAVADVSKGDPQDTGVFEGKCGHHWKHRHWGGHGRRHLWKKLNLTDAQKKEMFSIRLEERAKMKPLVQQLKAGRDQLRALPKGKFDETKVRAIAKEQANIITDLIVEKQRMKSRFYAVLTQEQRAKFEQMREKWKSRREEEQKHTD